MEREGASRAMGSGAGMVGGGSRQTEQASRALGEEEEKDSGEEEKGKAGSRQ